MLLLGFLLGFYSIILMLWTGSEDNHDQHYIYIYTLYYTLYTLYMLGHMFLFTILYIIPLLNYTVLLLTVSTQV